MNNDNDTWRKMKRFWKLYRKKKKLRAQDTHFSWLKWVVNKSPYQVAKNPYDKIWKFFLSVFREWKVHPQGSREGSSKTF